jgi:hypothetical protein
MLRRLVPLVVLVVLIVSACGSDDGASNEAPASSTTTASVASTVATTVAVSTTSTAVETTTTTLPDPWRYAGDDHGYAYQSLGYSCEADPTTGRGGDNDMSLVQIWLHKDAKDQGGASNSADCLDIMMKPQPGFYDFMDMLGDVNDQTFVDTGRGIRIVQLDSPHTGFDIGGKAWLELTVSSLSATEFAALPPQAPGTGGFVKYSAPTNGDPVSIEAEPDTTNFVGELLLVETTNDMMQWIVVLNEDETYRRNAGYWGGSGGGWTNGLAIKIGR